MLFDCDCARRACACESLVLQVSAVNANFLSRCLTRKSECSAEHALRVALKRRGIQSSIHCRLDGVVQRHPYHQLRPALSNAPDKDVAHVSAQVPEPSNRLWPRRLCRRHQRAELHLCAHLQGRRGLAGTVVGVVLTCSRHVDKLVSQWEVIWLVSPAACRKEDCVTHCSRGGDIQYAGHAEGASAVGFQRPFDDLLHPSDGEIAAIRRDVDSNVDSGPAEAGFAPVVPRRAQSELIRRAEAQLVGSDHQILDAVAGGRCADEVGEIDARRDKACGGMLARTPLMRDHCIIADALGRPWRCRWRRGHQDSAAIKGDKRVQSRHEIRSGGQTIAANEYEVFICTVLCCRRRLDGHGRQESCLDLDDHG